MQLSGRQRNRVYDDMDIISLITFAVALAIAAAIPGPGMTALVARALAVGFVDSIPMVLGLIFGDLVFLSLTALGLAAVATTFAVAFTVVKICGAAYLLYLAWKLWTSEPAIATVAAGRADNRAWTRSFFAGLSLTLSNPKTIVFYLALLPTLIDLGKLTALGFIEMVGIVLVVLAIVGFAYTGAAARARDFFRDRTARKRLDRTAGVMMAGAAIAVAMR